jgi:hypothetical protein
MKELVEVHKFTCDACGVVQYVGADEEILGLQGDVMEVTTTHGGMGGDWYACSRKCVAKAITNVLDRRD